MKKHLRYASLFLLSISASLPVMSYALDNHELTGNWRIIDDETGVPVSIVKIEKTANGTYSGTIIKTMDRPGHKDSDFCVDCPAPFTGKPILGLNIIWALKADSSDATRFTSGKILDPLSGDIYSAKLRVSADGQSLDVHGYIGISLFGRSEVWKRDK